MAIKKAHAYDTIAGKWIGRVPVTWFDNFPHLSHKGPDGERPDVPKTRVPSRPVTVQPEAAVVKPADEKPAP